MRLGLQFIFLLCLVISSWSQKFVFEKITTREGLSQNSITDIYQDKNGFLWIGTHDGLNRYDGYNFKIFCVNYCKKNGISSNLVFRITEDEDGNMWLGTSDEGVCKFDVKTEQFTVFLNT
jgi:ligand-binding sensor domain-containing protein